LFIFDKILILNVNSLVSIIIPTYNRAHLIGDTLDSIQNQTYVNWECIVIDDGSTDRTEALLQRYIAKDSRFKYYQRPNNLPKGANACRNYGFSLSKGDFINWFDSDDIMAPNKLEVQVALLNQHHEAPYCICQTKWVDKITGDFLGLRAKQITSTNRFEDYTLYHIFWSILAPVWRRAFIEKHELFFDESLHQSQEYDFHIKALAIDSDYIAIDDALVTMYRHDGNLSNDIYSYDLKIASNLKVKDKIINNHIHQLSSKGILRLLEIQTLMYKDLLVARKFKFGRQMVFCCKIVMAYVSYRMFGRGYAIVKPLTR
jgi:glycosyltransferase involved in cell wall biosynthesis